MSGQTKLLDVEGKAVLITGASGGIGARMARLFAEHGAHVGIHYNTAKENAERLVEDIRIRGGNAQIFRGDLLDRSVREDLVERFVKTFGSIDVLINNAGTVFSHTDFSELSEDTWDKTFDLNVKAPFRLCSKAFAHMKHQGGGRIVNIGSVTVKYGGSATGLHYSAAKAAMDNLTVGFAKLGAPHNILVNAIRCGVIDTPLRTRIGGYSEERFLERIKLIPLKRVGTPMDIASMALFLASGSNNFITGEILNIAGGD